MTPPTLKLPPRSGPAGPAKPPTSRQRRAQHGRAPSVALAPGHTLATPPAPADAPPRRKKPATAPRGTTGPEPALRRPPASTRDDAPPAAHAVPRASVTPLVPENPRLSKRMSELGLCSRREADEWIENGWVKVDGVVMTTLGTRVPPDARIEIDAGGAPRSRASRSRYCCTSRSATSRARPRMATSRRCVLIRPENRWPEDRSPTAVEARPPARTRAGRPARHRLHRPAGVHAGRPRRAAADRPRLGSGEGIPGAGRGHAVAGRECSCSITVSSSTA